MINDVNFLFTESLGKRILSYSAGLQCKDDIECFGYGGFNVACKKGICVPTQPAILQGSDVQYIY